MNFVPNPAAIPENIDIASIVCQVLRELEVTTGSGAAEVTSPDAYEMTQRLITLDDLSQVPTGAKQIRVHNGSVVTPAVHDELRIRGISLVRSDTTRSNGQSRQARTNERSATGQPPRTRSPFRRVRLLHDETVETDLYESVMKQVVARGIRLCDQASVTVTLSTRPATAVYRSIAANTSAVSINRIDDIIRFKTELRPTVYVLDALHLHLISMVNAIMSVARRDEQPITGRPKITVAGGQR